MISYRIYMVKRQDLLSKKIGLRIKDLRTKRGVTQEKLGELSGVDYKHIQLLESPKTIIPRVDTIQNIATAFGISISEFFSDHIFLEAKKEEKIKKEVSGLLKFKSPIQGRQIIIEDNLHYAFFEKVPIQRGQMIIYPKRNYKSFFESLPEEKNSLIEMIGKVKEYLDKEFKPSGYEIRFTDGKVKNEKKDFFCVQIIPDYQ